MADRTPWWDAELHADRRPLLLARNRLTAAIRHYFAGHAFVEVEAGILQISPGNEAHLHAFRTELVTPAAGREPLYLHTSPEFAAKKLLAAGERRIFDFARVFRNRERGRLHAPEFTMLEWYRADEDYDAVIADSLAVMKLAADVAEVGQFCYRGVMCDPRAEADRLTVADAFVHFAGIDLLATLSPSGEGDATALRSRARRGGITVSDDDDWSDMFAKILTLRVEPRLGADRPCILYEYPVCEAALARVSPHDARVAQRFELYACGVELANGF